MNDSSRANTVTEVKNQILAEGMKGLFLMNGGGAVALATWLQAVWDKPWATYMLKWQLYGMLGFAIGAAFAAVAYFVRYLAFLHRKAADPTRNPVWWTHMVVAAMSMISFAVASVLVVMGGFIALESQAATTSAPATRSFAETSFIQPETWSAGDWIALLTALATGFGVIVVWRQTGKLAQQLTLQHFSDYTKRYQDIILEFPEDVNSTSFALAGREDYAKTMRYMRAYVDLCYEEWYLNERRLIDSRIWSVWCGGMQTAFSKPAFRQAWTTIREDSRYGKAFESFVDKLVAGAS